MYGTRNNVARAAFVSAFVLFGMTNGARADGPTVSIDTDYLATLDVQLDPPQIVGQRLIFNVPAGTVKGPKISGSIVQPSGDWLIPMPDGSLRLDVRASIKTTEGDLILVEYSGVIVASKDVSDRVMKGEEVTYKDEYFITAPRFTTASKTYDWLNKIQAVGKMVTLNGKTLKYDIFSVR
jgi:hypothetical protein